MIHWLNTFDIYTARIFTHHRKKVKFLQSHNDTVFLDKDFIQYTDSQGTVRWLTVYNTLAQNGVVEHMYQTIFNGVRACLNASQLPLVLQYKAMQNQCWIQNRSPTAALDFEMPYKKQHGENFIMYDLHKFGQYNINHTIQN